MADKQWRYPILGFAALMLVALACGPSIGETGKSDKNESGENVGNSLQYTGVDTSGLSSFRSEFVMTFTGTDATGAPFDVHYDVRQAVSSDLEASELVVDAQGNGVPGPTGLFRVVQIGPTTYLIAPGPGEPECVSYASDTSQDNQSFFSPDTILSDGDFSGASRVRPDETVNGVEARHFSFTNDDVTFTGADITSISGDIWIALDGGYVVRQVVSAEGGGEAFDGAKGRIEWTYDIRDVNAPVNIQPPRGCSEPAGGDFPTMPDATELNIFAGTISYTTAAPSAEVVNFYSQRLLADGWVATLISTATPGIANLEYVRGSESASILIAEVEDGVEVLITLTS